MKAEKLIGKPCYEVIHGTKGPWLHCPHKKTLKDKRSATEEFFEPRLGIYLEVSTSPILNKKGEVIDDNAKRPSNPAVVNDIEALL